MIYEEIVEYMRETGISQSFLCERSGLPECSVKSALDGTKNISVDEYEKICVALNVPRELFFDRRRARMSSSPPPVAQKI